MFFLDNRLNEIERINFNDLPDFITIDEATNAGNNRLWIFNVATQQVELYNYRNRNKIIISQPFKSDLISMASNFNYCFALTEHKLRSFNNYGSLLTESDAGGFEKIAQQDENLVALKNNELYFIPSRVGNDTGTTKEILKLPTPQITIKDWQLTPEFLYIYDGKIVHSFTLTLPKK